MFKLWSSQKGREDEVAVQEVTQDSGNGSSTPDEDNGAAVETVAKILRILGRHAFDLDKGDAESFNREFERWARHVLLGTATSEDPEAEAAAGDGRRSWGDLCQFVNRHRQHEKTYVVKGFQDLRDVIWTFTSTLSQAFTQDKEHDGRMDSHIGWLRAAVESKTPEEMKREVLVAAEGLGKLVEDRRQQQRARMERLGDKLKEVEAELGYAREQMTLDPLTQLYNRAALDQHIERVSALSVISGFPACLLMIDIDHFKQVNDTYGHRAGDAVIRQLADRTVLTFPRKTDFVARYGGEEFVVLLQDSSLEVGGGLGERLLEAVRQSLFQHEDQELEVTVSVGLAELIPGESSGSWVERADRALYEAKQNGRNQLRAAGVDL